MVRQADASSSTRGEPTRRLLMPPLAASARAWDAAALTWALLRLGPGLVPHDAPQPSVAALQSWLRQQDDDALEAWMLDVRHDAGGTAELIVVSSRGPWRSGEALLPARPLSPDGLDLRPRAHLDWTGPADALRLEESTVWLESRWGRREVRWREDRIELGDLRGWSAFDRTWTERPRLPAPPVPVLHAPAGDRRLELRATGVGDSTTLRWWVARAGGSLPVGTPIQVPGRWLAMVPWPLRASTWIVLSEASGTYRVTALHVPLRAAPLERPRVRPSDNVARVWVEGGPADPTGFPRDRWSLWVREHACVSLARTPAAARTPTGEPDVAFRALDGARTWEITVPTPRSRDGAPGVTADDWAHALTARLEQPAPAVYAWLLEPLAGMVRVVSGRIRLELERPVPDLVERLAHPALALDDERLARRFASHRWEAGVLIPRHDGSILELRADVPAGLGPALRRVPLASADEDAREVGSPVDAVLVCSAAAPVQLRRRLAWALRDLDAAALLALDDPTLAALAPASRRPLEEVWQDAAAPGGALPRVGFLPIPAQDDPDGELTLAQRRLEILLPARGIEVAPADATRRDGVVLARLVRIAVYSGEPLLRSLELASWAGGVPAAAEASTVVTRPLGDARRAEAARDIERELLLDGALIPLWTEPGRMRPDASLSGIGPRVEGLPVLCWDATPTAAEASP